MTIRNRLIFLIPIFAAMVFSLDAQVVDSTSFGLYPRQNFYSGEKTADFFLEIPVNMRYRNLSVELSEGDSVLNLWKGIPGRDFLRLKTVLIPSPDSSRLIKTHIKITGSSEITFYSECELLVLKHKPNEVKTDRLTGALIVNNRKFFPLGFYCYSPVHPELPEEEVINGFNMISPYQRILPGTLEERKSYMDRCAQLGIKVHYNLLSVSGGGGVGSKIEGVSDKQKKELLLNEIRTFMDHPALLAWYIADEPSGNGIKPDSLEKIYELVRKTDPWHPVSIVFMAPFGTVKDYINSLDIVMADPYPVPDMPVSYVGVVADQLLKDLRLQRPLWMVPQAFGGGEIWEREPSISEIRSMTWQSVIRGATGIQYFIRQGPNAFPKSTAVWNECSRIALEIGSLAPWLLSEEESVPVSSGSGNIIVSSRVYNGQLIIMAVNKINAPQRADIRMASNYSGRVRVLFENRSIQCYSGGFNDYLPPYGSQVYKITLAEKPESFTPYKSNMIIDPGFEDIISPGVPSACYARPGKDRGATYFLDPLEKIEGSYSLRIRTPVQNKGVALKFFPVVVKPGTSYMISIWAKSDPEQRFQAEIQNDGEETDETFVKPQYVEIEMGDFSRSRFIPAEQWKEFVTFITIPGDTVARKKVNVTLSMPGQGVAWFDMLQVIEDPIEMKYSDR